MITAIIIDAGQHYCQAVSDLWQWDYGQTLRIQGVKIPAAVEVQFSTTERIGETVTRIGVTKEEVTEVPIPDTLLEGNGASHDYVIYAFIYVEDAISGKTEHKIAMNVRARPKPEAHATAEEGELFRQAIAAVSESADRAESARDLAEGSARTAQGSAEAAEQAKNEAVKAAESIKNTKVPTKTSELENDSHFLTADTEISWGRKADTTIGKRSVALGANVEASGVNSHAEGLISIAKGNGSHAEGFGTVASAKYQHVQGKYNVEDTEGRYAHIVGGGNDAERRNIHTLDWEGNAEYAGDVIATVNGKKVPMSTIAGVLLQPGAATHNAIYRGKYLGDTVTAEQAAAIADGSFEDLFIGDYWTMGGVNYRIADFDYWYRTGFPEASRVKKHHAVIVPDTSIATEQMNGSNTTSGGYRNSLTKSKMNDTISALPPEIRSRLLVHNALLDGTWTETSVDLMNEIMVYGCYILADNSNKQTSENRQLSLFQMSPQARYAGGNYWLRNYANATEFTLVSYYGDASKDAATSTYGIRPVFAITGENR